MSLELLRKAILVEGSQAGVAQKTGYDKSTVSQIQNGVYAGSTEHFFSKLNEVYGMSATEKVIPEGYREDAQGRLVPIETIREIDLARDSFVREQVAKAKDMSSRISAFKQGASDDMQAFLDMSAEEYDKSIGGARGNVELMSFDGKFKVIRAVADRIEFDERLQTAKALIDECLREWTKDSGAELRAIIDDAFQVDKKGRINSKRILSLRKLKIDNETWQRAMEAIGDAVTVTGSCTYFRFYERDERGQYQQVQLDFSGA